MTTTKKKTIKPKSPGRYKPNVGKIFALRKSRNINVKWTTAPRVQKPGSYYSYRNNLDNSQGDITVLVIDEWSKDVEILYNGHKYKISKYYITYPINDPDSLTAQTDLNLQILVKDFFALLDKHDNVSGEFMEFGRKLKLLQEITEKQAEKEATT